MELGDRHGQGQRVRACSLQLVVHQRGTRGGERGELGRGSGGSGERGEREERLVTDDGIFGGGADREESGVGGGAGEGGRREG